MKKILYTIVFLFFTPITLSISLFALWKIDNTYKITFSSREESMKVLGVQNTVELYRALPQSSGTVSNSFSVGDSRPFLIRNYLEKYKSPLISYADYIFEMSEKYELDYGLIVAIAQCESNVCKKIPPGSYNCWGFENGDTRFNSWEHAIERVAVTLKERYYDYGLITPDQIMPKYAPPSVDKGGPWAKCVNQFLEELR